MHTQAEMEAWLIWGGQEVRLFVVSREKTDWMKRWMDRIMDMDSSTDTRN